MDRPKVIHIPANTELKGQSRLITDIAYSESNKGLTMDLIVPWTAERPENTKKYPLVVFIQGSSWTTPDRGYEIPQLCELSRRGYTVATVGHRSIFEGNPFPAFLVDVKCAIRYLRANAEKYAIDADRVVVWGTSSGGNAALLVGLIANDMTFSNGEYSEYSDGVQAVVSCFGPTNIKDIVWAARHSEAFEPVVRAAFGDDESQWETRMEQFSPQKNISAGKVYPPFMLLHGSADVEVSYLQMMQMFNILSENGTDVTAVCVDNAGHEWDFWSREVYNEIFAFIDRISDNEE